MIWLPVALLFLLLATGIPVGFALAASGVAGLYIVGGLSPLVGVLQSTPLSAVSSYELMTIPMFLLMARLVLISKVADDLFAAAAAWVGRAPGGLGIATALAGAGFAAICGTSTAAAATLSTTSMPAMLRHGYEPRMAAGVIAISGTLAMLIPPSVMLILYGILAQQHIGKLLIGGIVPGILVTITIALTVLVLAIQDPRRAPPSPPSSFKERLAMLRVVGPMLFLMMMVTGIIYTGVATPTEASALGALGALGLAIWRRSITLTTFGGALQDAAYGTCMIAMIVMGATLFGYYFTVTQVTQDFVAWITSIDAAPWVIMVAILTVYIVLGCFMDQVAILVLTIPIVLPAVIALGFDPIWFGVVAIVTAEVGLVTPPLGLNCFVVARYANRPVSEVFAGVMPHVLAHLVVIGVLLAFPALVTWLPTQMN